MELSESIASSEIGSLQSSKQALIEKNQLIRIQEVSEITTLAKSSINLWVSQSRFPKPISLSTTIKVWRLQDIANWISSQDGGN